MPRATWKGTLKVYDASASLETVSKLFQLNIRSTCRGKAWTPRLKNRGKISIFLEAILSLDYRRALYTGEEMSKDRKKLGYWYRLPWHTLHTKMLPQNPKGTTKVIHMMKKAIMPCRARHLLNSRSEAKLSYTSYKGLTLVWMRNHGLASSTKICP